MRADARGPHAWQPGERVRVPATLIGLRVPCLTGAIVGPDPDWDGYYCVRLDEPAWAVYDWQTDMPVPEVLVAGDNLATA